VENQIEVLESLRRIDSDIVLDNFICGEWACPWWLKYLDGVHTVYGDTVGSGIPSPWLRDELITARDIEVFEERKLERQFPLWGEDLYGTQVRRDHLIDGVIVKGESMAERWEDEYVMALPGRGAISNNIMITDLEVLESSRGGLKFLGGVALWTKANEKLYADFHLLGRDPKERKTYGYSHGDGEGRAIVTLRNPFITRDTFALTIGPSLGLGQSAEKHYVNVVYPYRKTFAPVPFGDTVSVPLEDYQVLMLEVRAESRQFQAITTAARWDVTESGDVVLYDESPLNSLPSGRLTTKVQERGAQESVLLFAGDVTVPDAATRGQLQVMFNNPAKGILISAPSVFVDGRESRIAFHERSPNAAEKWAHAELPSSWVLVDLAPGRHHLEVALPKKGPETVQVGAWLRASYTLESVESGRKVSDATQLFPVYAGAEDRRTMVILEPQEYRLR
jgi:hypothetical protein